MLDQPWFSQSAPAETPAAISFRNPERKKQWNV
jgi:hypothetical protein